MSIVLSVANKPIMLNVIMLSVFVLSVVMLNVVAPNISVLEFFMKSTRGKSLPEWRITPWPTPRLASLLHVTNVRLLTGAILSQWQRKKSFISTDTWM